MANSRNNPVLSALRAHNVDVATRFAAQPTPTPTPTPPPQPTLVPPAVPATLAEVVGIVSPPALQSMPPEVGFGDMPLGGDPIFGDAERLQINHASGQIVAPRTGIVLAPDDEVVAQAPRVAWVHWKDGKIIDRVWKQPGQMLPERHTLLPPPPPPPDQDMWKKAVYWRLADAVSGQEFVFCGTASAIGPLGSFDRTVKFKRDRYGDVWPVVTIALQGVQKPGQSQYYMPVITTRRYVFEGGSPLVEE